MKLLNEVVVENQRIKRGWRVTLWVAVFFIARPKNQIPEATDQHVLGPRGLQRRFLEPLDVDVERALLERVSERLRRDALQPEIRGIRQ